MLLSLVLMEPCSEQMILPKNMKKLLIFVIIIALIIIGVVFTSAYQKYKVNTAFWPPGAFWTSNEEIQGYVWLKDNIQEGSRVFTFVNNAPIIAFDKFTCHWCPEVRDFQKNGINKTPDEIYSWLKKNKYEYLIVDGQTARKFGQNQTNSMITSLGTQFNLQPAFQNNGMIILRI